MKKESKLYLFMPEMRIFWFFILLVLGVLATAFFTLPPVLKVVSVAILAGIGFIVFINSSQIAKKNQEVKIAYARLTAIIKDLKDGVIAYDNKFKVLVFNKAAEGILGLKEKEIVGQTFTLKLRQKLHSRYRLFLMLLFPALAPTVVRRTESGVYPQITDFTFEDPHLELRVFTSQITDEYGAVVGLLKVVRDRTRELTLLKEKSEFVTVASHQLRTPLTGISWAWEELKKENLSPTLQELVDTGSKSTKRLLETVEGILDVAKIEEGRFGYQFSEIDIVEFCAGLVKEAEETAKSNQVKIYFDPPAQDEKIMLTADPQKLEVALANLIDNAMKYNVSGGEIVVKLKRVPDKPYVKISVRDTGVGIPKEVMGQLFKKFSRGENVKRIQAEGSGLGLYIAKNIVRRHGGTISVESTEKRGSVFSFTLPTEYTLIPQKEFVYEDV